MVIQRALRIAEREEAFAAFEEKIGRREEELCELAEDQRCQDEDLTRRLENIGATVQQAEEERRAAEVREERCETRQRELHRQQVRLQKRLERVASTREQLEEDRSDTATLESEYCTCARSLKDLRQRATVSENELYDRQRRLEQRENEFAQLRSAVKLRQEQLEPLQSDLQAKEADLNEREAILGRRRREIEEREACLERALQETASASESSAAAQQRNDEAERRLTLLWDDIHQRQQVVEDLDTSLQGREKRLSKAEHSHAVRQSQTSDCSPQQEAEVIEVELVAAELAERAWRERSAALAKSQENLLARVHMLEEAVGPQ